jgi:hypothetical protein
MPTRKQRRRQQKVRRHEYEYVYVDEEGNEVEIDPAELRTDRNGRPDPRPRAAKQSRPADRRKGAGRPIDPPSWRKAGRRALVIGPLLVVVMMLFNRGVPVEQQVAPAILMLAFFVPFSYFTDSLAYRMYRKRMERSGAAKTR